MTRYTLGLVFNSRMCSFPTLSHYESSPVMLAPWLSLSAPVLANGTSSFEKTHGEDLWSHTAANPDLS
ncbi:acetylserotonin o-methyltransferase [Quercus suber]|uniref:Acetylserotonin o-methyltransferase n=1 Tax=Quercus suber TaxID=58331 RepID=A0AAW0LB87_QUESU